MITSTNVGKLDLALTSSVSGALPGSLGPTTAPVFDSSNYWDGTNKQRKLIGQAAGVGGDRWNLQTSGGSSLACYDSSGTLKSYLAVNPSSLVQKIVPSESGYPVSFNLCQGVGTQDGQGNGVTYLAWNATGVGQRENLLEPTFGCGFENSYLIGGERWMEGHLCSAFRPDTGDHIRPLSVVINRSQSYKTDTLFQGSSWTYQNLGQTVQIEQLARATDESVYWKITGKDSSDANGYAIQLVSDAVTPQDNLFVGRKAGLNNGITVYGSTGASLALTRQGVSTRFVNDGNFAFICAAGQLFFNRTDDFIVCSRDTARLGLRIQDNGAASLVGFHGATPIAKQAVTGSRGGNAALADLLTKLAAKGLITDSTSA